MARCEHSWRHISSGEELLRRTHLGTNAGAARDPELNPAFPAPPMFAATAFNVSEVFVAEAGVNVGVEEVADGRNTLLPGLKTGADDVNGVGVVVPDSLVLSLVRFGITRDITTHSAIF
jgi:hypothetical protein